MSSAATAHRVVADRSACCGYGTCVEICPEIYQLEGGLVVLTTEVIPPELLERAIEGADSCPQAAIIVEAVEE